MVAPERYVHILIPRTCDVTLFGKRVSTDVIKDLEMRLPWMNRVGPKCHHKCPYKTGAEIDTQRERWCEDRDLATSQGIMRHQKLEEVRNRFSPKAPRRAAALPTPQFRTSGLQNSEENKYLLFEATTFEVVWYSNHRNPIQILASGSKVLLYQIPRNVDVALELDNG